jgi:pseudouridine-5'-phosphate glycosidase
LNTWKHRASRCWATARRLPAFYARSSGCPVDHRFDTPGEIAAAIDAQWRMGLQTGMVIANPIPEADALPSSQIEANIAAACREAESSGVRGKELTPFLLSRLYELTGGKSLAANIALVKNNATLAARIAVELAALLARD